MPETKGAAWGHLEKRFGEKTRGTHAELSGRWLAERGLGKIDPAHVSKLDSVEHVPDLVRAGKASAREVKPEHFALERFGQFY
jgi:hypothetical protein